MMRLSLAVLAAATAVGCVLAGSSAALADDAHRPDPLTVSADVAAAVRADLRTDLGVFVDLPRCDSDRRPVVVVDPDRARAYCVVPDVEADLAARALLTVG